MVNKIVSAQICLALGVLLLLMAGILSLPLDPTLSKLLWGFGFSLLGIPFLLRWVFQGRNEMFWFAAPTVLRQTLFMIVAIVLDQSERPPSSAGEAGKV